MYATGLRIKYACCVVSTCPVGARYPQRAYESRRNRPSGLTFDTRRTFPWRLSRPAGRGETLEYRKSCARRVPKTLTAEHKQNLVPPVQRTVVTVATRDLTIVRNRFFSSPQSVGTGTERRWWNSHVEVKRSD